MATPNFEALTRPRRKIDLEESHSGPHDHKDLKTKLCSKVLSKEQEATVEKHPTIQWMVELSKRGLCPKYKASTIPPERSEKKAKTSHQPSSPKESPQRLVHSWLSYPSPDQYRLLDQPQKEQF